MIFFLFLLEDKPFSFVIAVSLFELFILSLSGKSGEGSPPNLPSDWPHLTVTRVDFHSMICDFTVTKRSIRIDCKDRLRHAFNLYVPPGEWSVQMLDPAGKKIVQRLETIVEGGYIAVPESDAVTIQLMAQ